MCLSIWNIHPCSSHHAPSLCFMPSNYLLRGRQSGQEIPVWLFYPFVGVEFQWYLNATQTHRSLTDDTLWLLVHTTIPSLTAPLSCAPPHEHRLKLIYNYPTIHVESCGWWLMNSFLYKSLIKGLPWNSWYVCCFQAVQWHWAHYIHVCPCVSGDPVQSFQRWRSRSASVRHDQKPVSSVWSLLQKTWELL